MSNKKLLTLLISAVIVIWLATPFLVSMLHAGMPERGQFGDLYGSVNALFSGLAFAGLFYTIYLQTKQIRLQQSELKTQRQELRLQREEMAASREELANQAEAQRAMFRASVAQINVASFQAQIEALKMGADGATNLVFKQRYIDEINILASKLNELSDKVTHNKPDYKSI